MIVVNCFCMSCFVAFAPDISDPAWHPDRRSYHRGPAPVTSGINTGITGDNNTVTPGNLRREALDITIKWCKIRVWWWSVPAQCFSVIEWSNWPNPHYDHHFIIHWPWPLSCGSTHPCLWRQSRALHVNREVTKESILKRSRVGSEEKN